MNFRVWIKYALAAAVGVHCFAFPGLAQSPAERTTPARAIELVESHLDKAQREKNADLKRRMQVEAYLALLSLPSLPSNHRPYEAADRLRAIDEALAEKAASTDRELIEAGVGAARTLAEERDDLLRIFLLDRQYSGLSSGEGVNKQYFLQLMRANDSEAMGWFFQSMQPGVGEVAGIVNRSVGIDWLCQHGHRSLARQVATRLAAPELDVAMGLRLADLGASAEAEQRAAGSMTQTTRRAPAGPEILARLAVMASRRGDSAEVERLVRKVVEAVEPRQLSPDRRVSVDYGDCDWTLDRGFARRWQARSVYWQSAFKLSAQPGGTPPGQPQLVALADSVAGATVGPASVELIEQLIAIFDKSARDNGIDLTNAAILAADAQTDLARRNNAPALAWHGARQSLILARMAAGAPIDEAAAKALGLDWAASFLAIHPRSPLARRLAGLGGSDRETLDRINPRLLAQLQSIALVLEGNAVDARALVESQPAAADLDAGSLLHIIEAQQNAGLTERAAAALDAYLYVFPGKDLPALRLLMLQGRVDRAKAMLRDFVAGSAGAFGVSDIFVGVMLLRELGDRSDVATLVGLRQGIDAPEASRRLVEVADALAWDGAAGEIEAATRQLPRELAQLPAKDAACLRDTLQGLQAVALARRGELEAGLGLVEGRSLEQRQFCWVGKGYDSKPIFDLRFLVQEWVRRGHAAP
jgi:hypothetical protein